jgi:hypothetical protein
VSEDSKQISRRGFIATASMATAVGATGNAIAADTGPKRPGTADIHWDHDADIICVGSGAAALTAAVVACGSGNKVIVIEKRPITGGTTAKSGAVHWIPNNVVLRNQGIDDKRQDALQYMVRFSYPNDYIADHPTMGLSKDAFELIEAFYDNGSAMVDHLTELGVYKVRAWTYNDIFAKLPPGVLPPTTSTPDYLDHAPEDKVKSGRSVVMQREDGTIASGPDFIERFETYVTDKKGLVLTSHRARELILNDRREVIGVAASHGGKDVLLRARKAVIFGSGGFAQNPALVSKFQKIRIFGACATDGSEGDIVPIATRAGAALGGMFGAWNANVVLEQALQNSVVNRVMFEPAGDSMIFVNKYGKRFVNEFRSYNSRPRAHEVYDPTEEDYPNHLAFMIFDQRVVDIFGGDEPIPRPGEKSPWVIAGKTFAELSQNISARLETLRSRSINTRLVDDFAVNLQATVDKYNRFARSGVDAQFGRGKHNLDRQMFLAMSMPRDGHSGAGQKYMPNRTMHPLAATGPYYAVIIARGALDTTGGPVINAKSQIVDYDGKPIRGLYGAGNCIASPTRETYYGPGGTIGPAMTFAYIAAKHANLEPAKDL